MLEPQRVPGHGRDVAPVSALAVGHLLYSLPFVAPPGDARAAESLHDLEERSRVGRVAVGYSYGRAVPSTHAVDGPASLEAAAIVASAEAAAAGLADASRPVGEEALVDREEAVEALAHTEAQGERPPRPAEAR